jgi:HD-GYP domain-containing protein (c-di-GMP phosphodiesterase class II)
MMADSHEIALSELIGALSVALDVGEGEPPGHARRSCLIGMRVANEVGLDAETQSDLFYALLLKDAGCSANAAHMAALFGADDQVAKRTSKLVDWARPMSAFVWSVRTVAPDGSILDRGNRLRAIRNEGHVTRSLMRARCDRGADIAHKLGFPDATAEAIRGLDEHWDGHGQPRGLQGPEIPVLARILCLAQTAEVFHRARGVRVMSSVLRRRSGQWFDPKLVDALSALESDRGFWSSLTEADVSAVEPADRVLTADDDRLDQIAEGFAAVIDAKSSWTHEHCDSVGKIATAIAALLGLDDAAVRGLRRASLLHDLGKLSISNRILDKPGPLTTAEIERVRQHPLLTDQILSRVASFGELSALASAHHERIDGSGYPFGLAGEQLTMPMRILAIADVYEALVSDRPYRPAYAPQAALDVIRPDVPSGLDPDAFAALETLVRRDAARPGLGHLSGGRPPLRRVK